MVTVGRPSTVPRTSRALKVALLAASSFAVACQPEFTERSSAVTALRILGVKADPAETKPSVLAKDVAYSALVADANGTVNMLDIDWAYCILPTPVSELNDVSPLCLRPDGPQIVHFAMKGINTSAAIPYDQTLGQNACNQFGPDIPAAPDGGEPGRPADPDSTGGFYQPIRLLYVNAKGAYDFTLAQNRIRCNLPGATAEVASDYDARYRLNQNPEIDSVVATVNGGANVKLKTEDMGDSGLVVPAGTAVSLTASYASCPTVPVCGNGICEAKEDKSNCEMDCMTAKGCTGAEPYAYFDLSTRMLVDRREAIRVSWFTNRGSFRDDRTGNTEDQAAATTTENAWTAPKEAGPAMVWAVIRDSRGGLSWRSYKITVQ
jgi:hypothetical protein